MVLYCIDEYAWMDPSFDVQEGRKEGRKEGSLCVIQIDFLIFWLRERERERERVRWIRRRNDSLLLAFKFGMHEVRIIVENGASFALLFTWRGQYSWAISLFVQGMPLLVLGYLTWTD